VSLYNRLEICILHAAPADRAVGSRAAALISRPAEAPAKAELARKIAELIAKRRLTQTAADELLNIDQSKVSAGPGPSRRVLS
jgi:hypothetical protein